MVRLMKKWRACYNIRVVFVIFFHVLINCNDIINCIEDVVEKSTNGTLLFSGHADDVLLSVADEFSITMSRGGVKNPRADKIMELSPAILLLNQTQRRVLDDYDDIFEALSLYCNGRWMGVPVLQDPMDLMYIQHLVHQIRPKYIIETGTFRGGLTYFLSTVYDTMGMRDEGTIFSIDVVPPEILSDAQYFCPPCPFCRKPWEEETWKRHVKFLQGKVEHAHVYDAIRAGIPENMQISGPVFVNLDANHEFDGVLNELLLYAPFVTVGSYLVVQDAKLDRIWGMPAVKAAVQKFLSDFAPEGEFVIEEHMAFYVYTQHIYLRRMKQTMSRQAFSGVIG